MKLLTPTPSAELPAEALLARLRCRRAAIDRTVSQASVVPTTDVFYWVYKRLNRPLRRRLEPFLDLHAMRNLILALRHTLAGEAPPAAILNSSLLAEPLQNLTTTAAEKEATIAQLEAALGNDYPFVIGLTVTYRNQGPGGIEQQLASGILQHGQKRTNNHVIKKALGYLIDMRNCLMINKLWRWHVNQPPKLTTGGKLATTSLQLIWSEGDNERLARLTARITGEPAISTTSTFMEQSLLRGLSRLLRRAGRDPLGLAIVIEYLWLAQLAVHNQLLRKTLAPDREDLLEEVLLL